MNFISILRILDPESSRFDYAGKYNPQNILDSEPHLCGEVQVWKEVLSGISVFFVPDSKVE